MKFLPDNLRAGKIVEKNFTRYFIWDDNKSIRDNDFLIAPGVETMIVNSTTRFLYKEDFYGWDRMFNAPPFYHHYGVCKGSTIEDNQLVLFNMHQKFPVWKRMFATEGLDKYIMTLVGVGILDYRYRYNSTVCLDYCQSKTVQHLSELYDKIGIAPKPLKVKINNEDQKDFSKYKVEIDIDSIINIPDHYLYLGECTSRYEINNAMNEIKELPRFWNQRDLKKIQLSDIICDNQLELF
jgi:hypothetical protein